MYMTNSVERNNTVVPFLFIILLFVRLVAIKYKLSLHFSNSKNGENKE